jgi:hypothetical protein
MNRFDKVGAYAAVVTMIAAGGISARAQTNHFDLPAVSPWLHPPYRRTVM